MLRRRGYGSTKCDENIWADRYAPRKTIYLFARNLATVTFQRKIFGTKVVPRTILYKIVRRCSIASHLTDRQRLSSDLHENFTSDLVLIKFQAKQFLFQIFFPKMRREKFISEKLLRTMTFTPSLEICLLDIFGKIVSTN